jgi:hypothetical protein
MDRGVDFPERWTARRLAELLGGSTRKWWLTTGIPLVLEAGALRRVGRGYIGRRAAIADALMGVKS